MLELAFRTEPGTLQYDWFLNDDGTQCVVRETYASSQAVLEHLAHVGSMLGRLVELGGGMRLEVYGASSTSEVSDAIAPFQPATYAYLQGK